jgi:hypothetical protein
MDGEWVPGEGYHAFDLPDEPGDYDHRLKMLSSLKIPGVITLRSYNGHFAQVYARLPRSVTEVVVRAGTSSNGGLQRKHAIG